MAKYAYTKKIFKTYDLFVYWKLILICKHILYIYIPMFAWKFRHKGSIAESLRNSNLEQKQE